MQLVVDRRLPTGLQAAIEEALSPLLMSGRAPHGVRIEVAPAPDRRVRISPSVSLPTRVVDGFDALDEVLAVVGRVLLDLSPDRSHLHAAALALEGRSVLLLGESTVGKSTFTAFAAAAGWDVLSDECIGIDADGSTLCSWPRPLVLRRGSPALEVLPACRSPLDGGRVVVPLERLGARQVSGASLGAVVLLDRRPDTSSPQVERYEPSQAICVLGEHSLDVDREPARALLTFARIAARAPVFRLQYAEAAQALPVVAEILANADVMSVPIDEAEPVGEPPWQHPRRGDDVEWVGLDGRLVLLTPPPRRMVRLDPAAARVWRALDGRQPVDDPAFVAELRGLGVLDDPRYPPLT
jgi:hypothetical protein